MGRNLESSAPRRSPGFVARGFLAAGARAGTAAPTLRPTYYAAFNSVVAGAGGVVWAYNSLHFEITRGSGYLASQSRRTTVARRS
jgi:hypothetical protein